MSRAFSQGFGTRFGQKPGGGLVIPRAGDIYAHYMARAGTSIGAEGVSDLVDQGPNGLDLYQLTGSQQPELATDGEGRAVIRFPTIEDNLRRASSDSPSWNIGPTLEMMFCTAFKYNVIDSGTRYFMSSVSTSSNTKSNHYTRVSPVGYQSTYGLSSIQWLEGKQLGEQVYSANFRPAAANPVFRRRIMWNKVMKTSDDVSQVGSWNGLVLGNIVGANLALNQDFYEGIWWASVTTFTDQDMVDASAYLEAANNMTLAPQP